MSNIDETSYLLNSSNNAARLMESIAEFERGLGKQRKLIEDQDSKLEKLDSFTKEDYQNHFKLKARKHI